MQPPGVTHCHVLVSMCKDDSSRAACQESLIFLKGHCHSLLMLHETVRLLSVFMCVKHFVDDFKESLYFSQGVLSMCPSVCMRALDRGI